MTVKELIEKLEQYPEDALVAYSDCEGVHCAIQVVEVGITPLFPGAFTRHMYREFWEGRSTRKSCETVVLE